MNPRYETPALLLLVALLILALCGCSPSAALPMPPPPPPVVTVAVAPPSTPAHAASVVVVRHFDRAKARELSVVLAPATAPDDIDRIHDADQKARTALTALGLEGRAIKAATLAAARDAVHALEAILDAVGQSQAPESSTPVSGSPSS